jgi:hypothetical protein
MRLCHGGTNEPDLMGGTNGVMQTHDNTAIKRSSHERHSDIIVNTASVWSLGTCSRITPRSKVLVVRGTV